MPNPSLIRVRFAPSPTGDPHIGSMWTAQMNWLFAKQRGGTFIMRLEDTDRQRFVAGSVEKIYEALQWYGLVPDEGPVQGGELGPYVQSERLGTYRPLALQLVEQGSAYYCFCTPERLEQLRQQQQAAHQPPRYDKRCASIPPTEAQERVSRGEPAVIRLNVPLTGEIVHHDIIRRRVTFQLNQIHDSVLLKSDGFPTYHLANVIDDHLMEISHVIRAEEWLPSVPKHLLLYKAFDWTPPQFAHLPLLLGSDKTKLSKRHGATSALSFRDEGYLPETMRNFLGLMGWHPKGDEEILSAEDLIQQFSLDQVNPSGAVFDQTKLNWLNGQYIRQLSPSELRQRLAPYWHQPVDELGEQWLDGAIALIQDRLVTLNDIDELVNRLFPIAWTEASATMDWTQLLSKGETAVSASKKLTTFIAWLETTPSWEAAELKTALVARIAEQGWKNGPVLWPVRVALSLQKASPDVFDILALLGKEESVRRLQIASKQLAD